MARETDSLKLADALAVTCVRLVRTLRGRSRSADLSEPEISALAVITYSGRLFARDLAAHEGVTPATISRLVAALEAKGFVQRAPDKRDERLQWITPTKLGKRRVREGHLRRVGPLGEVIARLPDKDRATLTAAAAILTAAIADLQKPRE